MKNYFNAFHGWLPTAAFTASAISFFATAWLHNDSLTYVLCGCSVITYVLFMLSLSKIEDDLGDR